MFIGDIETRIVARELCSHDPEEQVNNKEWGHSSKEVKLLEATITWSNPAFILHEPGVEQVRHVACDGADGCCSNHDWSKGAAAIVCWHFKCHTRKNPPTSKWPILKRA